jgi:hypothetical protein
MTVETKTTDAANTLLAEQDACEAWSAAAAEQSIMRGSADSRARMLYSAGANLWVALQHELGRR